MLDGKLISLYNYNSHNVFVSTPNRPQGIAIKPYENDMAGVERFSMDEVRHINQISAVIRNGILRIEPEFEDEVKTLLGIYAISENDWTPEEILDAVLKPTTEKLESMKKITSTATLDNFLSIISAEELRKEYLVSDHVREIILARRDELLQNIINSKIEVVKKTAPPKETKSRGDRLKKATTTTKK